MNTVVRNQKELFNAIDDSVALSEIARYWRNYGGYVNHHKYRELDKQSLLVATLDDGTEVECQHDYSNFYTDAYVRSPTHEKRGSFNLPSNWQSIRVSAYGVGCYQSGVIARKNKDGKTATTFPFPEVERI